MPFWLRIATRIDRTNEWIGRIVYWLTLVMVLIGAYNALVRYLDRFTGLGLSSNTYIELQWYLYSLVFLLGAAYTLKHNAHVRVDVLFAKLSPRGRAWINLLGTILFLIPFCVLVLWTSWPAVRNSWIVGEMSPDPGGLPRYPIKAVIPLAFFLLMIQGVSLAIKQIAVLRGHLRVDEFSGIGGGRSVEDFSEGGRPGDASDITDSSGRKGALGEKGALGGEAATGGAAESSGEDAAGSGDASGGAGKSDASDRGSSSGLHDDESDDGIPGAGI